MRETCASCTPSSAWNANLRSVATRATLSAEHRAVLHLAFVLDRSLAEIAEIAEIARIPTGTVKTRLFYAKRALRRAIDASGLRKEIS